jgi:hypothetical protein
MTVGMEIVEYARDLAERRRREARDDIVTRLLQPDDAGELLSAGEFECSGPTPTSTEPSTSRWTITSDSASQPDQCCGQSVAMGISWPATVCRPASPRRP